MMKSIFENIRIGALDAVITDLTQKPHLLNDHSCSRPPLIEAIRLGKKKIVQYLLMEGAYYPKEEALRSCFGETEPLIRTDIQRRAAIKIFLQSKGFNGYLTSAVLKPILCFLQNREIEQQKEVDESSDTNSKSNSYIVYLEELDALLTLRKKLPLLRILFMSWHAKNLPSGCIVNLIIPSLISFPHDSIKYFEQMYKPAETTEVCGDRIIAIAKEIPNILPDALPNLRDSLAPPPVTYVSSCFTVEKTLIGTGAGAGVALFAGFTLCAALAIAGVVVGLPIVLACFACIPVAALIGGLIGYYKSRQRHNDQPQFTEADMVSPQPNS